MSVYSTHRIGLASFLRFCGIPHIETRRLTGKSFIFVFDDPEGSIPRLEYEFLSGSAVADAMALLEADRELKQTIAIAREYGKWDTEIGL